MCTFWCKYSQYNSMDMENNIKYWHELKQIVLEVIVLSNKDIQSASIEAILNQWLCVLLKEMRLKLPLNGL